MIAAFGAYFCAYGFRKPFTADPHAGEFFFGIDFKTILIVSQVMGYTVSKFIGIKVVSEITPRHRVRALLVLIGIAQIALLLFAVVPAPWNGLCLFLNGLPLGMTFGMVLGFLEGRVQSEALTAGLCCSFIISGGFMKSVGAWLLGAQVSQAWMPSVAGFIFIVPMVIFTWMLSKIPPPTRSDEEARCERVPMDARARSAFFMRYATGLSLLALVYLLTTILRSLRDDFAPEIWAGLGVMKEPEKYALSETVVGLIVTIAMGAIVFMRNNRTAFFAGLLLSAAGFLISAAVLTGLSFGLVSPFMFMVLSGLGIYFPYIAVHTCVFERLIAMTRDKGNIGYLLYLVDAFGYLGYVVVLLAKGVLKKNVDVFELFKTSNWLIAAVSLVMLGIVWRYFANRCAAPSGVNPSEPCDAAVTA